MFTLDDIGQRLEAVEGALSELYLPSPLTAEEHRPRKPIGTEHRKSAILRQDPNNIIIQGDEIWSSKSLETGGFSHQNGFVQITVFSDSIPANLGWQPLFTVELQGACGSPWSTLDSAVLVSGGLPGTYTCPVLRGSSSSLEIRLVVFAADNVKWTPPAPGRVITYSVEGVLIAGYEM